MLFDPGYTREQALKARDKVFSTTFFSERLKDNETGSRKVERTGAEDAALGVGVAAALLIKGAEEAAAAEPVDKRGGGRYA